MESNEGLCFFSTLDSTLREPYRDIELFSPPSLEAELEHFISFLSSKISLQIREHNTVEDSEEVLYKNQKTGKKE